MESLIALSASLVTAFQLVPQTLEAIREKDVSHLSKGSFVMICISNVLWILHGSNARDAAIIFANVIMFGCSATILYMMMKGKKGSQARGSVRAVKVRKRRR